MAKARAKRARVAARAERRRRYALARVEKAKERARHWAGYRLRNAQAKLEASRQHLRARDERLGAKGQEPQANVKLDGTCLAHFGARRHRGRKFLC